MNNEYNFSYQLKEYFDLYLNRQRNLSRNTISTYKYAFLKFIYFLKDEKINIDSFDVRSINFNLISKFVEYLKSEENSNRTVNLRITVISSFLEYVSSKLPSVLNNCNQIHKVHKLREGEKIHEYFTVEELKKIMEEAEENIKYYTILALLYDGALRVSELTNIKINDVILNRNNPEIIIENSKGGKQRKIVLSNKMVKILRNYLKDIKNQEYLFENKYGDKYSNNGITKILKKYWKRAKEKCNDNTLFLIKPHCHMIRHSKGVHLVDNGVPLTVIKEIFGHSHIQTTEIYARISTEKRKEILENNSINAKIRIKRKSEDINELEYFLKNNDL